MKKKDNPKINLVSNSRKFMGIIVRDNEIEFYVPETFRVEKDRKKRNRDLLIFLKTLELTKYIEQNIKSSEIVGNIWPIESYIWIIKDYLEYGVYYKRENKFSNKMNGKINWKKTMRKNPIYSKGNFIYDEFITSKKIPLNDKISEIYKICLMISINRIGWAFNCSIHEDVNNIFSKKEMVNIVINEINSTFDDIKRLRFNHMLKILKNVNNNDLFSNNCTYGVTCYYYVFEKMVDILFRGIGLEEKKKYFPYGIWLINGKDKVNSSNLRPDTIYKRRDPKNINKKEIFILDAKMYNFASTYDFKDLPNTSSMQKQITYGDFVKNNLDRDSYVRNAFILPCNKETLKNNKNFTLINDTYLAYFGKAFVNYRNSNDKRDYEEIFSFFIDYNYLINNYKKQDINYITSLCNTIDEHIDDK